MGRFSKHDFTHFYNLATKIHGQFAELLKKFHFFFVNPESLRVRAELFGYLTVLPDSLPWAKIALLCHCYMCKPDMYNLDGNICWAEALQKGKVEKLASEKDFVEALRFLSPCSMSLPRT